MVKRVSFWDFDCSEKSFSKVIHACANIQIIRFDHLHLHKKLANITINPNTRFEVEEVFIPGITTIKNFLQVFSQNPSFVKNLKIIVTRDDSWLYSDLHELEEHLLEFSQRLGYTADVHIISPRWSSK